MDFEIKRMFVKEFFGTAIRLQIKMLVNEDENYWLGLSGVLDLPLFKSSIVSPEGKNIVIKPSELIEGRSLNVTDVMSGELVVDEFLRIAKGLPSIIEITKKYKKEEIVVYDLNLCNQAGGNLSEDDDSEKYNDA